MFQRALSFCAILFVLLAPRLAAAGGALIAKDDPNSPIGAPPELPLERTDVNAEVSGSVVGTTVTQRFKNTYDHAIEVVYLFPLPEHAAVDAMEMKIGRRTITGSIARREEARAAYVAAVRDGRRAAMLEQERPNLFTFSVGNIDAGATVDVKLHYFEVAKFDHGTYEITVPTTLGPRFNPPGTKDADRITTTYTTPQNTKATIGIRIKVDGGTALESVSTPAWETEIARPSATVANVKLKHDNEIPNRDFTLRWRLKAESFEPAFFVHRASDRDSGYLTLMLEPKHDIAMSEIAASPRKRDASRKTPRSARSRRRWSRSARRVPASSATSPGKTASSRPMIMRGRSSSRRRSAIPRRRFGAKRSMPSAAFARAISRRTTTSGCASPPRAGASRRSRASSSAGASTPRA
jgi:hypothetical protein